MKANKVYRIELLINDRLEFRITATTAISAIKKIQELYLYLRRQAEIVHESDSHILTEDSESGELVYLDLRRNELGSIKYEDWLYSLT